MLRLLKGFIEEHIEPDFKKKFDVKDPKENYEVEFEFKQGKTIYKILAPYTVNLHGEYNCQNSWIGATNNNGKTFSIEDENLEIRRRECNPNSETLQQKITKFIDDEVEAWELVQEDIDENPPLNIKDDYAAHM